MQTKVTVGISYIFKYSFVWFIVHPFYSKHYKRFW